jgi:hypothetical protein
VPVLADAENNRSIIEKPRLLSFLGEFNDQIQSAGMVVFDIYFRHFDPPAYFKLYPGLPEPPHG